MTCTRQPVGRALGHARGTERENNLQMPQGLEHKGKHLTTNFLKIYVRESRSCWEDGRVGEPWAYLLPCGHLESTFIHINNPESNPKPGSMDAP